jgi:Leucine-rich repeat (LRR) protein
MLPRRGDHLTEPKNFPRSYGVVRGRREMSDNKPNALVLRPAYGLQEPGSGAEKVLSRVVADALALARAREIKVAPTLIRVGNYDFREEDYAQILIWAFGLAKTPEELVFLLESTSNKRRDRGGTKSFIVEEGVIKSIQLSARMLDSSQAARIWTVSYLSGLEQLICGTDEVEFSPLPKLTRLQYGGTPLTTLDLSYVPALTSLTCWGKQLASLDLSPVPKLTFLTCVSSHLAELDLSPVPALTRLSCWRNELTKLNLSPVPTLTHLSCGDNKFTKLDLSYISELTFLNCEENELAQLDLSSVPKLTYLDCAYNHLAELDLSPVPALTSLRCWDNQIRTLDVRGNPQLKTLCCDSSVRIIKHEWQSIDDDWDDEPYADHEFL